MSEELDRILSIEESAINKNKEIDRILSCSPFDYYSILEINPLLSTTTEELLTIIKKVYRKKSLLIHPDKSDNPKASEAFDLLKKSEYHLTSSDESDIKEIEHLYSIYQAYKPTPSKINNEQYCKLEFNDIINIEIRSKVKQVLIDEINELNLNKLIKQTELLRKDEMKQKIDLEKKIKQQLDKNWEDERDLRVNNWRKYSNKIERKQKQQQQQQQQEGQSLGKVSKKKKKNVLV
ncbi:possible DnaJ-like splicing factor, putative [Candida dubliniensis CD36]|uniref:Possible DnaJ-like splicing factor, putative n=1 Tax=Candida dubliniensis (strain CD36 / ATCC MYA-646 / CBS 7987 / NCPF 3949 / NRRL Y-17841) TaxID=573826 RepID=B9WKY5_CANDC|nr:possible DnaJ-like splicing factor, putative [Candida dubliniensis CD36]CAX39686.1 possible DnaJ-like splicing factor, putative [Candida dubliniensis CD36]